MFIFIYINGILINKVLKNNYRRRMKFKAIVCDLDGTLLNPEHTISKNTIDTIKKITAQGVKFFIATRKTPH